MRCALQLRFPAYLTGRQLPDKAVDLLDTAAARVRMSLDTVPEQLTCIRSQITSLEMEKQALLEDIAVGNQSHGERLTVIEQEENVLSLLSTSLKRSTGRN
jgi:type VI secretion system protein VasG